MLTAKQNKGAFNNYLDFLGKNKQDHAYSKIPNHNEWVTFAKILLSDFKKEDKLKEYQEDLSLFLKNCKLHKSMSLLAGIKWMDLSVFQSAHKTGEEDYYKTQIFIPKSFIENTNDSPYSTSKLAKKSLNKSKTHVQRKEQATERLVDRVFEYLTFEITHGDNFFKDLIIRFDELFRSRYHSYLSISESHSEVKLPKSPAGNYVSATFSDHSEGCKTPLKSCQVLKSHISDKSTVVGDSFIKCAMPKPVHNDTLSKALDDVKDFMTLIEVLLFQIIDSFASNKGVTIENTVDKKLKEVVHSLIFHPRMSIYKTLTALIQKNQRVKERNLSVCSQKWKVLLPEDFNVDKDFCLEGLEVPYLGAIEALNMLQVLYTPEEKLCTICFIKDEIVKSIDTYWKKMNPDKKASELSITADQLVPIYTYIAARSGYTRIGTDIMFINSLLDESSTRLGEEAYFLATLNIAFDYLQSLSTDDSKYKNSRSNTMSSMYSQASSVRRDDKAYLIEEAGEIRKGNESVISTS